MDPSVTQAAPAEAKIALFRSLFRGREDVYPRRFESRRTGRSGYQPACANEWVPGVCDKTATRCNACPSRRLLPLTDEVVRAHLLGRGADGRPFVIGLYPLLRDDTCFCLAADFDGPDWRKDAEAVRAACLRLGLPAAFERSRSGGGCHLWFFFEQAIPAQLARKLGAHVLTETMEGRPEIGLATYDRFVPGQDTLPHKGFGNLIALPLQREPRERGNSVFLDERFEPRPDQWAFLATVRKLSTAEVERLVRAAESRDRVIGVRMAGNEDDDPAPWLAPPSRRYAEAPIAGPLPARLDLVLADQIYIPKEGLPPALRNRLVRLAAFQNPEFYRAQAMRQPIFRIPRIVACAEEHAHHLALPRGCAEDVQRLLAALKIEAAWEDKRCNGTPLEATFHGTLRPDQQAAAEAMARHDTGVLAATTGFGKTVLAAWLIARRGVNTLVLVHREQLMEQWVERLSVFLDLPAQSIGRIGGGRRKPTGRLDVALIQSLVRKGTVDDRVGEYGHLVADECHHLSAPSFELVARRARPRYVTGLSATVTRKDGHHPIILMQCGPIRHRVDARRQAAARPFAHVVLVRPTSFRPPELAEPDVRRQFLQLCQALTADEARNRMICDDVLAALREGRSPVVLTERTGHLARLQEILAPSVRNAIALRGGMGRRQRAEVRERLAAIPAGEERVLLATGRYLGEGFDDARLDSLFLAMPVSWRGTVAQYAGRLHREHDGKRKVRIYDYADLNAPMLEKMFNRRCRGYEAIGYSIQLPASAVPGWPAGVPLPVDPEWKRDYAASVRRLVRDGVDAPLADLFVHAARPFAADAEGEGRARSAAEAFLYRRLETLSQTRGRFRLNAELAIPFDGRGRMEVDLLCEEARVAVEIDGPQHFSDPASYRRDRRKDVLLQEHGFFVLRFLAEDAGKRLDDVLDAVLHALSRSGQWRPMGTETRIAVL
jgi:superfamily II DNA or RNA helicase/very-short-patch-repair endonuclease